MNIRITVLRKKYRYNMPIFLFIIITFLLLSNRSVNAQCVNGDPVAKWAYKADCPATNDAVNITSSAQCSSAYIDANPVLHSGIFCNPGGNPATSGWSSTCVKNATDAAYSTNPSGYYRSVFDFDTGVSGYVST